MRRIGIAWMRVVVAVGLMVIAVACSAEGDPPGKSVAAGLLAPAEGFNPLLESSSRVAPDLTPDPEPLASYPQRGELIPVKRGVEPFSSFAIQIKLGFSGPGFDIATPVASKLNLRIGANFFSYNPALYEDGINIVGDIELRSITENFDFFPFGNSFRISPGVVFYNGNHIHALASVPGGQTFSLNNVDYISDPADPVSGTFDLSFGNQLAPSLTLGFGNMIPRKGGHWSVPFEIGAEYLGRAPRIALTLGGSACQGDTSPANCGSIASDPSTQQNLAGEQADYNSHIPTQLRFFPIVSLGVSYRFGRAPGH